MQYYSFRAMNTEIDLAAEGAPRHLSAGFEQARAYIEASEQRFTRFSDSSELARLNLSTGSWFRASDELFDILQLARSFYAETRGLFNPAILTALESAGYDRSMDEIRSNRSVQPENSGSFLVPNFSAMQLDKNSRRVFLPPGMRLDLGGIAKGWIAECAARILERYAQACAVNAGGDLFIRGLPSGSPAWHVGLEDPFHPDRNKVILNVGPGAVATSSVLKRRWKQGEQSRNHLIDPRSGQPVETDWLSVTVVASHAATAEVFAKALLIAGPAEWESALPQESVSAWFAIDRNGKLWGTQNSKEFLYVANETYSE